MFVAFPTNRISIDANTFMIMSLAFGDDMSHPMLFVRLHSAFLVLLASVGTLNNT